MRRYNLSITRWRKSSSLAKCSAIAIAALIIAALIIPFTAMAQNEDNQGPNPYLFSMKPVVIGEGQQTIHVSSQYWDANSQIAINASGTCDVTFNTSLPATATASSEGRTHFELSVSPGTAATGINESDSTCRITATDGSHNASRPLRQIAAADKNVMILAEAPSVVSGTNEISWEDQGHPPGVWFLDNGSESHVTTWWKLTKVGGYEDYTWRKVYSENNHPGEASLGSIPKEWTSNSYDFCTYVAYMGYKASPQTCHNTGSEAKPAKPTRVPTKQPTPTPQPAPTQVIGNEWEDGHCNKVLGMQVQPEKKTIVNANGDYEYSYGLFYQCSATRYNVVQNSSGQWVWDDTSLPSGVNGSVYVVSDDVVKPAPGSNPYYVAPGPSGAALLNNGTARQFTVHADEPVIIVVNPSVHGPSNGSRLRLFATQPFNDPCRSNIFTGNRLSLSDGQTFWLSSCDTGNGYFDIRRQSDGSVVTTYRISVVETHEPFSGKEHVLPGAPILKSASATPRSITFGWNPPTNHGSSPVGHYLVEYRAAGSPDWISYVDNQDPGFARRFATIRHLDWVTTYQYRVSAKTAHGIGPWATGSIATIENLEIVGAPTGPITIREDAPVGSWVHKVTVVNHEGSDYLAQVALSGADAHAFAITSDGRVTTNTEFDYEAQVTYNFSIDVHLPTSEKSPPTALPVVAASAPVVVQIQDVVELPAKPYTPTLVSATETAITVEWGVKDNSGRPPIVDYDVLYSPEPGVWVDHPHNGTSTRATITGLTGGQKYLVQVRSRSSDGVSHWSGILEVRTIAPSTNQTQSSQSGGFTTNSTTQPYIVFSHNDGLTPEQRETLQQMVSVLYAGFQQ